MYDDTMLNKGNSISNSYYQARHEEGNFFSYPTDVRTSDGYNDSGKLFPTPTGIDWSKSIEDQSSITFDNANSMMQTYDKKESIEMSFQGRSTNPSNVAGNTVYWMPYVAREGTLVAAGAVQLKEDQVLWKTTGDRDKLSVYHGLPDPALPLPGRYSRNGANFVAELRNNDVATKIRGFRFYVPELGLHSDSKFLGGLTYEIKVPLYNASFLDTGEFKMSAETTKATSRSL